MATLIYGFIGFHKHFDLEKYKSTKHHLDRAQKISHIKDLSASKVLELSESMFYVLKASKAC